MSPNNAINSQKAQAQHALTDARTGCSSLTTQAIQMCQRRLAQTLTSGYRSAGRAQGLVVQHQMQLPGHVSDGLIVKKSPSDDPPNHVFGRQLASSYGGFTCGAQDLSNPLRFDKAAELIQPLGG